MEEALATYEQMLRERGRTTTALAISIFLRGLPDRMEVIGHLRKRHEEGAADVHHSVFLVQVLCWEGRAGEAEQVVHDVLRRRAGLTIGGLRERIAAHLPGARVTGSSFETYSGSPMQNFGFFEHAVEEPGGGSGTLVTKLATLEYAGTEPLFMAGVYRPRTPIARIAPRPVDVFVPEGSDLCIITMEKAPGAELVVQDMADPDVDRFLAAYRAVHDIGHGEVDHLFPDAPYDIAHSHAYLVPAMRKSHVAEHFAATNAWLVESVRRRGYTEEVRRMVERMVLSLEGSAFQRRIRPALHYGLLHGDMHRYNVLRAGDGYRIIDWGQCGTGPKGIDLAVLFRRFPYGRTVAALERAGWWGAWPAENRVLFAYALVLVSVMIDLQGIKDEPQEQLFGPATRAVTDAVG